MQRALRWLGLIWPILIWGFPIVSMGAGLVPCGDDPTGSSYLLATGCNLCDFGQLVQNVINYLTVISIPISALLFFYAGYLFLTAGGNQYKITQGRRVMGSAVIGFLIVCAAWLVIQTIVVGLTQGTTIFTGGSWNTLSCVDSSPNTGTRPRQSTITDLLNFGGGSGTTGTMGGGAGGTGIPGFCNSGGICSVGALQSAGFNPKQAAVMSCIAMTESSGNPNQPPYNQSHPGSNSTACGLFQITQTTWNTVPHSAGCSSFSQCTNGSCNTVAAQELVANHGYTDWTCPGCNNKAQQCVSSYGGA